VDVGVGAGKWVAIRTVAGSAIGAEKVVGTGVGTTVATVVVTTTVAAGSWARLPGSVAGVAPGTIEPRPW